MSEDRTVGRDPDWTDAEAEGQPATDEQPPGIDAETASEGRYPPRTHPVAAEEAGVTPAEEAVPETVRERVARERPDGVQRADRDPRGRLVEPPDAGTAPGPGREVADWEDADPGGLSAEEAAVHVVDEQ
jgi:hypothetical protein